MFRKDEKYVIVGFGWVGQANAIALKLLGSQVFYYDPNDPVQHYKESYAQVYDAIPKLQTIDELDSDDTWYFVCVGDRVTDEGVQDISHIRSALNSLKDLKGKVILRSTVLPPTLSELSFDYYVPEFLHEQKAVSECINPYFFVVGSKEDGLEEPSVFKFWRKQTLKVFKGSPQDASYVKYLSNIWNASRIAFVNEFGDAIGYPNSKSDLVRINRILSFVLGDGAYLRYGQAFGGHCLPKDTRAFRTFFKSINMELPLITGVYDSNEKHSQIEKNYPIIPEWYSEWPSTHLSGKLAIKELQYSIIKHIKNPSLFLKLFGFRKRL